MRPSHAAPAHRVYRPPGAVAGFALLEFGVVLAVTGVIVAVAVSAYQTYSIRADVVAGIVSSERLRGAIETRYASRRTLPESLDDLAQAHMASRERSGVVDTINIADGRIDLLYGGQAHPDIADRTLSLTPYETADLEIVWICGNRIPGPGLKPLGFSTGGPQAVQIASTIEARYLPRACR